MLLRQRQSLFTGTVEEVRQRRQQTKHDNREESEANPAWSVAFASVISEHRRDEQRRNVIASRDESSVARRNFVALLDRRDCPVEIRVSRRENRAHDAVEEALKGRAELTCKVELRSISRVTRRAAFVYLHKNLFVGESKVRAKAVFWSTFGGSSQAESFPTHICMHFPRRKPMPQVVSSLRG